VDNDHCHDTEKNHNNHSDHTGDIGDTGNGIHHILAVLNLFRRMKILNRFYDPFHIFRLLHLNFKGIRQWIVFCIITFQKIFFISPFVSPCFQSVCPGNEFPVLNSIPFLYLHFHGLNIFSLNALLQKHRYLYLGFQSCNHIVEIHDHCQYQSQHKQGCCSGTDRRQRHNPVSEYIPKTLLQHIIPCP